ncbi:MAG TPA: prepilin-type N-terminal cleavage/methylation domain-containing protein [Acidobacteriota bacterium]|nr:prepilin-type N-terminal cleavage/methylation domain-containing protein [Acidobacteriota bacterium]HNT18472.1 prepilin-type N-terminal cleavage/methylation domain-containing protein [Acidobacteriota bacterium]
MARNKGFTIIELLIVVAIIGIIAAIAIPNMMDAIERSRQKKTVDEIRTMVIAMQSFAIDFGGYPNSTHNGVAQDEWPLLLDAHGGTPIIIPSYIQAVPGQDGWGQDYIYYANPDGDSPVPRIQGAEVVAQRYCVWSTGSDRDENARVDGSAPASDVAANWCQITPVAVGTKSTYCYESDIVWGDSNFQQSPDGKQKKCG